MEDQLKEESKRGDKYEKKEKLTERGRKVRKGRRKMNDGYSWRKIRRNRSCVKGRGIAEVWKIRRRRKELKEETE